MDQELPYDDYLQDEDDALSLNGVIQRPVRENRGTKKLKEMMAGTNGDPLGTESLM